MEKSLDSLEKDLRKGLQLEEKDLKTYSPLTFAYIGDSVYELVIRTMLVRRGNVPPQKLHARASRLACAPAQARMAERLLPEFTQEERAIYRRGRNARPNTRAKNATMSDYCKATGLEAVLGYLYLREDTRRIVELIRKGILTDGKQGT